jgi:hypothetical protein
MATVNSSSGSGYGTAPARERAENLPQERHNAFVQAPIVPKQTGYGLPCARCKAYYAADLPACPICKNPQRVSPAAPLTTAAPVEQLTDPEQIEKERDRFLQEMNSQVIASPLPPDMPSAAQYCSHVENHTSSPEPATICQECFDRLQERVDVLEAATHMDLKEAAQLVYDAVWADPSDPTKTYQNAAQALLSEVRRRSGIPQVFGNLQPGMN